MKFADSRRAPERGRFTDGFLDPMRAIGDPVADGPMAEVLAAGGADRVNALLHSIVRTGDPDPAGLPDSVTRYLDATVDLPEWADGDKIARAQRFFGAWGLQISACLFCASLPSAYACANGVRVLELTARLDTDTRRRIMETGQFLMDVMAPGGMGDDGLGRRTIQRVRLMHAAVRGLIDARAVHSPDLWNDQWGRPINQEDLAGTLMSFGFVPAGPLRRLGVDVSDQDADDYLHCWKVIGHQMGVRDDLLPTDVDDAQHLVDAIRVRQTAWSVEGEHMTTALVTLLEEMTPGHRVDVIVPVLIRRLVGDDVADVLGLPPVTGRQRLLGWLLAVGTAVEDALGHDPVVGRYVERFARELLEGIFLLERGGDRASFAIPDTLRSDWNMSAVP